MTLSNVNLCSYVSNCYLYACLRLLIIGYEPAGLTVHPPPQNDREWVHFIRMGV